MLSPESAGTLLQAQGIFFNCIAEQIVVKFAVTGYGKCDLEFILRKKGKEYEEKDIIGDSFADIDMLYGYSAAYGWGRGVYDFPD